MRCSQDQLHRLAQRLRLGQATRTAAQWSCDGLTDEEIYRYADKWLARLLHSLGGAGPVS